MGSCCTKNVSFTIAKGNRISEIRSNLISVQKNKTMLNKISLQRDYFYAIQMKAWIVILDFLPYKDLCQARKLNKILNKAARNQQLLKKFYKNRRSLKSVENNQLPQEPYTIINNNQNITNHYNYTTINNFSSNGENSFVIDLQKLYITSLAKQSELIQAQLFEVPTFNDKKLDTSEKMSVNSFNSLKSPKIRIGATCEELNINKVHFKNSNQYIDIFSKKEIEFNPKSLSVTSKNSLDVSNGSFRSSRSNKTPSFSQWSRMDSLNRSIYPKILNNKLREHSARNNIKTQKRKVKELKSKFKSAGNSKYKKKLTVQDFNDLPIIYYDNNTCLK